MTVGHPDSAVILYDDSGRSIEMSRIGTGNARRSDGHQQLSVLAEFIYLMTEMLFQARGRARIAFRGAVSHPHIVLLINEQSVRECNLDFAEAFGEFAVE